MVLMLWKPVSFSGEITTRIPSETTRDRDLLGVSPAICELFRSFTRAVESKDYVETT